MFLIKKIMFLKIHGSIWKLNSMSVELVQQPGPTVTVYTFMGGRQNDNSTTNMNGVGTFRLFEFSTGEFVNLPSGPASWRGGVSVEGDLVFIGGGVNGRNSGNGFNITNNNVDIYRKSTNSIIGRISWRIDGVPRVYVDGGFYYGMSPFSSSIYRDTLYKFDPETLESAEMKKVAQNGPNLIIDGTIYALAAGSNSASDFTDRFHKVPIDSTRSTVLAKIPFTSNRGLACRFKDFILYVGRYFGSTIRTYMALYSIKDNTWKWVTRGVPFGSRDLVESVDAVDDGIILVVRKTDRILRAFKYIP